MAPSTFFLDDTCQAEVRLGPKPMVSLMRRRVDKPPTSIILTPEEWSQMTRRMAEIEVELLMNSDHSTPFLLNFTPTRVLTISSYHDNDYVGIFKYGNHEIKYYYGLNLTSSAWQELCRVKNLISEMLPNKPGTEPVMNVQKQSGEHADPKVPKRSSTTVQLYKWVKMSDDGCLVYGESSGTFYSKDAALKDAKRHPVDFTDTYGLETIVKSAEIDEIIFHDGLAKVASQTYAAILRKLIRKRMTEHCEGCFDDQPGQQAHENGCLAELDEIIVQTHLHSVKNIISFHTFAIIVQSICTVLNISYDPNVVKQSMRCNIELLKTDSSGCSNVINELVNVKVY